MFEDVVGFMCGVFVELEEVGVGQMITKNYVLTITLLPPLL